jgi:lysophospholipase L1-like esterase
LAYSDTIAKTIIKYKPTYVFIVVGLNEMYAKDLDNRRKAAQILAKKISGIPYTWIGPANYREDYGINMVFKESAEIGAFYLTKNLNLPKGQDKRHPSKDGYRIWMDSLASWIQSSARYKISMAPPKKRSQPYKSRNIILNAATYRGY